ncbi:MAG: hypothetical protein PHR19_09255 [Bacteroidales bacterium]|nr:hypothetical protein [Bacteroidales bacterium]
MFDYSKQIEDFYKEKINLSEDFKNKLYDHRKANRERLIARLPDRIEGISISNSSFKPQGSMAVNTIIQTRFPEEEYDIDDGLILNRAELKDKDGNELTHEFVRESVKKSLEDKRFSRQPKFCTNCIRVFYADEDEEKHHVDFPVYRWYEKDGSIIRELANKDEWIVSDPTQVNSWFNNEVQVRNNQTQGKGTQFRVLIKLLKRFCRSRREWDLPNGMKLTMLVAECQPKYSIRIDEAFYNLVVGLEARLDDSLVIKNLAHPDQPEITKTFNDQNMSDLHTKLKLAYEKLQALNDLDCDKEKARKIWDWIFKTDGFFDNIDDDNENINSESIARSTPSKPVDYQGGGRFGCL